MEALALWHEPDGPTGEIGIGLAQRGIEVSDHIVTDDYLNPLNTTGPFPAFADYDFIVVMGSVRSLTRKAEIATWIDDELDAIRTAHQAGQPILGVCFGGQLLADALGGSVEAAPTTEIGWFDIDPVDGANCPVGAGPWMQWHHDRFIAPAEAEVLAKSDAGQQLFRIGRSLGTQFHPEITQSILESWIGTCDNNYIDQHGIDVDRVRQNTAANQASSAKACHSLVDWFLDTVAFPGDQ